MLDESESLPARFVIYRCTNNSTYDPHHWVEVEHDGFRFVWDRSGQKIGNQHIVPKEEAIRLWLGYGETVESLQIFPSQDDRL